MQLQQIRGRQSLHLIEDDDLFYYVFKEEFFGYLISVPDNSVVLQTLNQKKKMRFFRLLIENRINEIIEKTFSLRTQ